jgi:hypothetical protein
MLSLAQYGGQTVQVAFHFHSDNYGEAPGWFVDEVTVESGPYAFDGFEDWEGGLGQWSTTRGYWQVGTPTNGPSAAYAGEACAGTVLGANYLQYADSRLVSPPFQVPSAEENPRLRFWHWFQTYNSGDFGEVQLRVGNGNWVSLSEQYYDRSGAWTRPMLSLAQYGGQTVQVAFHFHSDNYGEAPGWFVDEVTVESGPYAFDGFEDWEGGLGQWSTTRGYWQVGTPTNGPSAAYAGEACAGTVLGANYLQYADSRLVSPPFQVPPAEENPRLRFWHWFQTYNSGDFGEVQLRVGNGNWVSLSDHFFNSSGAWTHLLLSLGSYGGESVQVAFYFHSDNYGEASGWYIDDIQVDVVPVSEPWIRVLPGAVDFGSVEIGDEATVELTLSNIGSAPLHLGSTTVTGPFSLMEAPPAVLAPLEEALLPVRFAPLVEGNAAGELEILSDAVNRDTLRIGLSGFGGVIPLAPTGLRIATGAAGTMHLEWDPVTETVFGTPLAPDAYLLFNATEGDASFDDYVFLVAVPGTSYNHLMASHFAPRMFYRVLAYSGPVAALDQLVPGLTAAAVLARLGHPLR